MCPVERRADGELTAVIGASRTGKTSYTLTRTAGVQPLLVWDPDGQWTAMRQAREVTRAELIHLTRTLGPAGRLCYVAPPIAAEFDFFCRIAWSWARLAPSTIVVEELADVTNPGKAPAGWGVLIRRGLKYGTNIIATTQSPAESDKTVIRNALRVACFLLEQDTDQLYVARRIGVPLEQVAGLKRLEYLERIRGVDQVRHGRVSLPGLRKSSASKRR